MRKLPVYFLIDVSESMAGEPIWEVEKGLRSTIGALRGDPYALETVWISILVFAGRAEILTPLTELPDFKSPKFPIGGGTNLGKGLDLLMNDLKKNVVKSTPDRKGDWKPIVFLFTDGAPTDNPDKAVKKWNENFRDSVHLIAVTFGDHSDVALLEKLTDTVLTLKDTGSASFTEFFKWITASIQISSQAVSDFGEDASTLPEPGINLVKASPFAKLDENFVVLRVKCANTKNLFLAKYEREGEEYNLLGAYPVDENKYNALGGRDATSGEIKASALYDVPSCPYCESSNGFIRCGHCGGLFCAFGEISFTCPWCGNKGKLAYGEEDFSIARGRG